MYCSLPVLPLTPPHASLSPEEHSTAHFSSFALSRLTYSSPAYSPQWPVLWGRDLTSLPIYEARSHHSGYQHTPAFQVQSDTIISWSAVSGKVAGRQRDAPRHHSPAGHQPHMPSGREGHISQCPAGFDDCCEVQGL